MTDSADILSNQTQFSEEEPLLHDSWDPPQKSSQQNGSQKMSPKKMVMIGLGIFGVILVVLSFALSMIPGRPITPLGTEPSPTPVVQSEERNRLRDRLDETRNDLRSADPFNNDFSYPPIETNISIDGGRR